MKEGYVYLIKCQDKYKIGRSKSPDKRIRAFSVKMPFIFEIINIWEVDDMVARERDAHQYFSDKRINGEWFSLDNEDVEMLNQGLWCL